MPELFPYQAYGVEWLKNHPAALLADDMGLGKTAQAIRYAEAVGARNVLVVCPASLKINWQREWAMWAGRKAHISNSTNGGVFKLDDVVVIINYDVVHARRAEVTSRVWDLVIFDEAHYLKNQKARRTRACFGFRSFKPIDGERKLLLTGTPVLNKPVELWTLLRYLRPDVWRDYFGYVKRYCGAFKGPWGWDVSGATNLDELQRVLRSNLMLRRRKEEVLTELPPKLRQIVEVEPDSGARKLIQRDAGIIDRALKALGLGKEETLTEEEFSEAVWAMMGGDGIPFEEQSTVRRETGEAKIPAAIAHLTDAVGAGHKVVAFAWHQEVIQRVAEQFPGCAVVTGDTSVPKRQSAVDRFQTQDDCNLFIGQINAAGVGLTLTASSHVVFIELPWSPALVTQAEDRCHRIGQHDSVLVQHLVLANSLDSKMAKVLLQKQRTIWDALDTGSEALELSYLLS